MIKIYNYDNLFVEFTQLWINNLVNGLLSLENYYVQSISKIVIADFFNSGINGVFTSVSPEILDTLMQIKMVDLIKNIDFKEEELQELFIIKELINAIRLNLDNILFDLAKCFCSKSVFNDLFQHQFKFIKEKGKEREKEEKKYFNLN